MVQSAHVADESSETSSISTSTPRDGYSGKVHRSVTAPSAPNSRKKRQTLDYSTLSGFPGVQAIAGVQYEVREITQERMQDRPPEPQRAKTVSDPTDSRSRKHQSLDLSSLSGFPGEYAPPARDTTSAPTDPLATLDEELAALEPFVPDQPRSRQSIARANSVVASSPYVRSRLRSIQDRPVEYRRADRPTRLIPGSEDPDMHEPLPAYAEETNSTLPLRHRPAGSASIVDAPRHAPMRSTASAPPPSTTPWDTSPSTGTHPALRSTYPIAEPLDEESPAPDSDSGRVSPMISPLIQEFYAPAPLHVPPSERSPSPEPLQRAATVPHDAPEWNPGTVPRPWVMPTIRRASSPRQSTFARHESPWRRNRAAELQQAYQQTKPKKKKAMKCVMM